MTRAQREKQKKLRQLPWVVFNEEEFKWYKYCADNGIRISPTAVPDKDGKWYVGISTPDNHRKIYNSPEICDADTIWPIFHKYTKYYYDKR